MKDCFCATRYYTFCTSEAVKTRGKSTLFKGTYDHRGYAISKGQIRKEK